MYSGTGWRQSMWGSRSRRGQYKHLNVSWVTHSGAHPDFMHLGTRHHGWKKLCKTGTIFRNLCLLFVRQRWSETSPSISRRTHWVLLRRAAMGSVRSLSKIRQAAWLDTEHEVAKRASLDSARELGAKSLGWLLEDGYRPRVSGYRLSIARKLPQQNPAKAVRLPEEAFTVHGARSANFPAVCGAASWGSDSIPDDN